MKKIIPAPPWRLLLVLGVSLAFGRLTAQESTVELPPYVLSATRTPAALPTTGTFVDTIGAAELARMQLNNLRSALSGIPGPPPFHSAAAPGVTPPFFRAPNPNQTPFLVDLARFPAPTTPSTGPLR